MLSYEKIFSRVRNKINDPKELSLNEEDLLEIYIERLHSVAGNVRVKKKFKILSLNDETQEMNWALAHSSGGDSSEDEDFVIELFALGMVIEWLKPKVESTTNVNMIIGGKEEKTLNNAYKSNVERLQSLKAEFSGILRDHGYLHNSYLKG